MKSTIYVVMICFSIQTFGQECPGSIDHYWNFDLKNGGYTDRAGGLTAQAEVAPLAVPGVVDSGLYFNGLSEISVPDNITFDWEDDGSFSIEFWIRKTSVCAGTSSVNNNVVIGRDDPNTDLHWWVGVDCQTTGKINFTLFSAEGSGIIMKTKKGIIDGNWHHIVAVRDGQQNSNSIFVDGELDTSVTYSYPDGFASIVPVNVGWLNRDSKYHLDAYIDELAIHNVALSGETIAGHYNSGEGVDYCEEIGTGLQEADTDYQFSVYPTTVSSELHISFELNRPQKVSLTAYDVTGRKVARLIDKNMPQGIHNMSFSADIFNKSSVILLELKLDNTLLTKKIIIQ